MWHLIAHLSDIPPFRCFALSFRDQPLLLCRIGSEIFCVEDRCSHRDISLQRGWLEGCDLVCPLHGGAFDLRTGQATRPPAFRPIRTFPLQITDHGQILLFLPA